MDVVFARALAVFVFRKSQVPATVIELYFVASKSLLWVEAGQPKGLAFATIWFFYYLTAARATFRWHAEYQDQEEVLEIAEEVRA